MEQVKRGLEIISLREILKSVKRLLRSLVSILYQDKSTL